MANKLARQIEDILAELSPDAVFPSTEGQAFITLPTQQTFPLLDPIVQDWLTHRYTHREGTPPNEIAVRQAISTLKARAYCTTRRAKVALRTAQAPAPSKSIYIDLANEKGEAVEITEQGWQVTRFTAGVAFRSTRGQLPIPPPTTNDERTTTNEFLTGPIREWLLSALRPAGPYPILILHGPPGSGKTTLARMLRSLIDPVTTPVYGLPSRDHAIEKLAIRHRVLAFDHVTRMSNSAADALCRIASGTGIELSEPGDRRDPILLETARPIILTTPRQGLSDWQPRPDLATRAIAIHLPKIENPRPQAELQSEFESIRPRILAALYTALSQSLNDERTTTNDERAEAALAAASAQTDPIFQAVTQLLSKQTEWTGTATDLLNEICVSLTPRTLSHRLHQLTQALSQQGIQITHQRKHAGLRQITLRLISPAEPERQMELTERRTNNDERRTCLPMDPCTIQIREEIRSSDPSPTTHVR